MRKNIHCQFLHWRRILCISIGILATFLISETFSQKELLGIVIVLVALAVIVVFIAFIIRRENHEFHVKSLKEPLILFHTAFAVFAGIISIILEPVIRMILWRLFYRIIPIPLLVLFCLIGIQFAIQLNMVRMLAESFSIPLLTIKTFVLLICGSIIPLITLPISILTIYRFIPIIERSTWIRFLLLPIIYGIATYLVGILFRGKLHTGFKGCEEPMVTNMTSEVFTPSSTLTSVVRRVMQMKPNTLISIIVVLFILLLIGLWVFAPIFLVGDVTLAQLEVNNVLNNNCYLVSLKIISNHDTQISQHQVCGDFLGLGYEFIALPDRSMPFTRMKQPGLIIKSIVTTEETTGNTTEEILVGGGNIQLIESIRQRVAEFLKRILFTQRLNVHKMGFKHPSQGAIISYRVEPLRRQVIIECHGCEE